LPVEALEEKHLLLLVMVEEAEEQVVILQIMEDRLLH
jgi:hypothetical protein